MQVCWRLHYPCKIVLRQLKRPLKKVYQTRHIILSKISGKVEKYDTHAHINAYDTSFIQLAKEDNFRLLALNVNPSSYPTVEHQQDVAVRMVKAFPEQVAWATTFQVANWGTDKWLPQTLDYIQRFI